MEVGIRFGGADNVSIALVEGWPEQGLYYRPDRVGDHTAELVERYFTQGSSVFHDGDELDRYFFLRVKRYAQIESLVQGEIWHAAVHGTCHEGHFVSVADASSWIKWFRRLTPEQYARKVFGRDYGFPPYGVGCYCDMEGLVPGSEEYSAQNSQRKLWRWMRRFRRNR